MNYPPYSNDPNDPHSQPTMAGQYPQWGQPEPTTAGQYPQWEQQAPPPPQPPQFLQQPGQYPQSGQSFPPYPQQYSQNGQWSQPGQFGAPPQQPAKPTFKQRFRGMPRWKRFGTIGCSTIIASILLCSLCAIVGNALPAPSKQPSTADIAQVSPTEHQVASIKESIPTPRPTETPAPTPTVTPTPMPVPTQAPVQQQQSVQQQKPSQQPMQQPASSPATSTGVNGNPWGYDFNPGNLIYSPPSAFCSYFNCIASFWKGSGYVIECNDATYSKSGGRSGSCSHHGGDWRALYSH